MESIFKNKTYMSIFAFLCALGWSLAYPFIKIGYQLFMISPSDVGGKILFAGIRFTTAGLFVLLFCYVRKIPFRLRHKTDFGWLLSLAIVNTSLHYMFAYLGLGYNASSRSTILDSMGGFLLILFSILLFADDVFSLNKVFGCLLGITGVIMINLEPGVDFFANISFRGDGMILLNAFCAAIGGILTRIVSQKMNIVSATGLSMFMGGIFLIVTGLIIGIHNPWQWSISAAFVLLILVMISAVCFSVYNELLTYHPISEIAIYNALIPVLGVIFATILLREPFKLAYIVAVVMVALGICLVNKK